MTFMIFFLSLFKEKQACKFIRTIKRDVLAKHFMKWCYCFQLLLNKNLNGVLPKCDKLIHIIDEKCLFRRYTQCTHVQIQINKSLYLIWSLNLYRYTDNIITAIIICITKLTIFKAIVTDNITHKNLCYAFVLVFFINNRRKKNNKNIP